MTRRCLGTPSARNRENGTCSRPPAWCGGAARTAPLPKPKPKPGPPMAFIGVRAAERRAIGIQDRVFLGGQYVDPVYAGRRESAFLVAVNCGTAGGTCFCVSMDAGPKAESGFDLALTELMDGVRAARARLGRGPAARRDRIRGHRGAPR